MLQEPPGSSYCRCPAGPDGGMPGSSGGAPGSSGGARKAPAWDDSARNTPCAPGIANRVPDLAPSACHPLPLRPS